MENTVPEGLIHSLPLMVVFVMFAGLLILSTERRLPDRTAPLNVGIGLFVASLNDVIDLHEKRLAALGSRLRVERTPRTPRTPRTDGSAGFDCFDA
jgi:hypothetical protein